MRGRALHPCTIFCSDQQYNVNLAESGRAFPLNSATLDDGSGISVGLEVRVGLGLLVDTAEALYRTLSSVRFIRAGQCGRLTGLHDAKIGGTVPSTTQCDAQVVDEEAP